MAAVARRLVALRDGEEDIDGGPPAGGSGIATQQDPSSWARFEALGPRSTHESRARQEGSSACGAAKHVRCLSTAAGFYVPVAADPKNCLWDLWFVPARGSGPGHEPARFSGFFEHDEQFTTGMLADDLDGDGVVEAVVLRDGKPPSAAKSVIIVKPTGESLETPFAALRDVDGDGQLDGVWEFRIFLGQEESSPEPHYLTAPALVAHRRSDGRFSLTDEVARAHRRKECHPPLTPLVTGARGIAGETESARRIACLLADGSASPESADAGARVEAVRRELAESCPRVHKDPEICRKLVTDTGPLFEDFAALAAWPAQAPKQQR